MNLLKCNEMKWRVIFMKTNSRLLSKADVGIIFRLAKHFNNEIVCYGGRKFYVNLEMNYIIEQF